MMRIVVALLLMIVLQVQAAVQFDGVDDYIDLGTSAAYDFADTTFTPCLWFSATVEGYLIARRNPTVADTSGWFIRINSDGTLTARIIATVNNIAAQRVTVSTTALDGNRHHVCAVMTTNTSTNAGNDISLYYDGALDQGSLTGGTDPYAAGTYHLQLGALEDLSGFVTGVIDDVRIYGSLSAENVDRLYKARMRYGGPKVVQVAYWPLDDCGVGTSGDAVTFRDRWKGGVNGTGVDGGNNTGLTCQGSKWLTYPGGN